MSAHAVGIVVYPDFQGLSLAVASVFEHANLVTGERLYRVHLTSENGGPVMTSQTFSVNTERLSDGVYDTLIIAGDNRSRPQSQSLVDYVRQAPSNSRRVASICSGAFILAEAGLLDGKRATTHWLHVQAFRKRFPQVLLEEDRILVVDGQIWTAGGMTAGIDLGLALVENDLGQETALAVARRLVTHQRRGGGQSQFSSLPDIDAESTRVQQVLRHIREHLRDDLSIEALAEVAGLSPRQFSRVFREETGQSPAKAVERLRLESARVLVETTRDSLDLVAQQSGFGETERMRQAFVRGFGQTPQMIRRMTATLQRPTESSVRQATGAK
jgi:transcriptional regulator GlxA family with amidase domain